MNRWIDLDELRRDIAAEAKARALAAGLERVTVRVTIAEPDRRQRRAVTIDVEAASEVSAHVHVRGATPSSEALMPRVANHPPEACSDPNCGMFARCAGNNPWLRASARRKLENLRAGTLPECCTPTSEQLEHLIRDAELPPHDSGVLARSAGAQPNTRPGRRDGE